METNELGEWRVPTRGESEARNLELRPLTLGHGIRWLLASTPVPLDGSSYFLTVIVDTGERHLPISISAIRIAPHKPCQVFVFMRVYKRYQSQRESSASKFILR